ncbi:SPFH domain-containing protein [Marinobacterium mangrovicola]|uniref:SPFH domain/Band 7 family protein n=1 Tax=Marinobacterium mangrovicola TaxID=1476959 RepID=A0A4R1GRC5_9GAMM|nr:SPFH domain-containing protein [Marinobacterium mangrovicola]TCK08739.1 SPFH domain/Band 7 family protein [Marinobacterium mangrovicola]
MDQSDKKPLPPLLSSLLGNLKQYSLGIIGACAALLIGMSSFFTTELGYTYVVQDTLFGSIRVYTEPGVHFKVPMFSNVYTYNQAMTLNFGNQENGEVIRATRQLNDVEVQFADTYTASIPATFRFKLSADPDKIIAMHREFRSYDNLIDSLLIKNAKNVTVVTATQYTGEEFFQGGLNKFKVQLEDQLQFGLYQTERRQVEVEQTDLAAVSSENDDADRLERKVQLVWKNIILQDKSGQAMRLANPLDSYGIQVRQVTIGRPFPEKRLDELLVKKKDLVAKRITAIQAQETARAEAKTAQLEKEIEKARAIQDAQRAKELAIISKQKEVEMERQQAELEQVRKEKEQAVAVLEKETQLEVATAERDIQKANAEAATYAAKAIREKGLAEAEVAKAHLLAKQAAKDIYMAEIQRDIADVMYPALKETQIKMPEYYVGDGSATPVNSLDVFTSLGAMDQLKKNMTAAPAN